MPTLELTDDRRFPGIWSFRAMPMSASDIESLIRARLPDARISIRELAADGDHCVALADLKAAHEGFFPALMNDSFASS